MSGRCCCVFVFALSCTPLLADSMITWDAPQAITSASDISTEGTLIEAFNFGEATDRTVNGVTFLGRTTGATGGQSTFPGLTNTLVDANLWTGSTGSAGYDAMLDSISFQNGDTGTATITGLAEGTEYLIELWFADNRNAVANTMDVSDGMGNDASLDRAGEYLIGRFIADATLQQSFNYDRNPNPNAFFQAFQLRELAAVPEPASITIWTMLGLMITAAGYYRMRRKTK